MNRIPPTKRAGDKLLSLREAADEGHIHWQTLRKAALYRREIPYLQRGRHGRIYLWRNDLLAWLERSLRPALREA